MPKKLTLIDFIEKSHQLHGDKYDYSMVEYKNNHTTVQIKCPIHGYFNQKPMVHLRGCGCPKCANERTGKKLKKEKVKINVNKNEILRKKMCKLRESFIQKALIIHGDRYDYSKVDYINNSTKVCIIDKLDNSEFFVTPANHLRGQENPKFRYEKIRQKLALTKEEFIKKSNLVHNGKYDYSKVEYINNRTKVCIICPKHGEFWQNPDKHMLGRGCRKCQYDNLQLLKPFSNEVFIEQAKKIHGDKYDYSKVDYKNNHTEVIIICNKHGEFKQQPTVHLRGAGCKLCNKSLLEQQIKTMLEENNILYEYEKKFDWLRIIKPLTIDFYLPEYNIGIECQGEQHYKPVKFFGGEEKLHIIQSRDRIKKELCENNGLKLLYYSNKQNINNSTINDVYLNLDLLLNEIVSTK